MFPVYTGWGHRGVWGGVIGGEAPYLGEEQIDRGNNDKLHIFIPLQYSARPNVV